MKTPITYYGGKQNLVKELVKLIPEHYQYCEPFVGGGAFLFAKPKSKHEAINDIDNRLITFWEVLQTNFDDFYKMLLSKRLHSEKYFNDAKFVLNNQKSFDKISIAWAYWYVSQLSFGHSLGTFAFGNIEKAPQKTMNKINQFDIKYSKRLHKVEIFNRDAIEFIKLKDSENTFFYLDPPYIDSDCGDYEDKKEVYYRLVELLPTLKSKWLLSSFENDLTIDLRNKFNSKSIKQVLRVTGKRSKTKYKNELLVWNYHLKTDLFSYL